MDETSAASRALELVRTTFLAPDLDESAAGAVDELDLNHEELAALRSFVEQIGSAAAAAKKALSAALARYLGPNNIYVKDGQAFRVQPSSAGFTCKDTEALIDFLGSDWPLAFNLAKPKIGALKEIAASRGLSPDAIVDTLGQYDEKEDVLSVVSLSAPKAPKFIKAMPDGSTAYPPLGNSRPLGSTLCGLPAAAEEA